MAVPDTNTFALSDVISEVNPTVRNSLGECFNDAGTWAFNPSYEGSKDRLSNFRDYDETPRIELSPSTAKVFAWDDQGVTFTYTVNMYPSDATFIVNKVGDTTRFTVTVDQTANTIEITPLYNNTGSTDWSINLTVTSSGYTSDSVGIIQTSQF